MASIPATLVHQFDDLRNPGDFMYYSSKSITKAGIVICCPSCGKIGAGCSFEKWSWDGNINYPTLSPSVNCTGCCGWHGYLKAGHWND